MKTKLTLVMEVDYEHKRKADLPYCANQLHSLVDYANRNGMLSGDSPEVTAALCSQVVVQGVTEQTGRAKGGMLLDPAALLDLRKLLDYSLGCGEKRHYTELSKQQRSKHVWPVIKRLAKAINHEV